MTVAREDQPTVDLTPEQELDLFLQAQREN
jgi:hypothetical protein